MPRPWKFACEAGQSEHQSSTYRAGTSDQLRPFDESETSSLRSVEFLELAQAADGFGVFELNLVSGAVKGIALFLNSSAWNSSPPSVRW